MQHDVAVIGGGIVGLATAYQLTRLYPDKKIVVLEKEERVAFHQSGRNSGVIHSGIYYKPGSLKAENCREGKKSLVEFCEEHDIAYEMCGKVIVAVNESELKRLDDILQRGNENRVSCRRVDRDEVKELEPHCAGIQGIHVPESGIVDYVGVSEALARIIASGHGELRCGFKVSGMDIKPKSIVVKSSSGDAVEADYVINCAGLYADKIARMSGDIPEIQVVPFRGEYYGLVPEARKLCRNLIYPVPDPAYPFLGVHFTRMHDGRVECGPSAIIAFAREGYTFGTLNVRELAEILRYKGFLNLSRQHWRKGISEIRQSLSKKYYLTVLKRLIPDVQLSDLEPAAAGVRAQALKKDGSMVDDFLVKRTGQVINVYNAASPAATACLNIGKVIAGYVPA